MRPNWGFLIYFVVLLFVHSTSVFADSQPLAALFQQPKVVHGKGKKKHGVRLPISEDYTIYFRAKALLNHPATAQALMNVEREILLSKMTAKSHSLDKELEEMFYAMEIKRGTKQFQKKLWGPGLDSVRRGLNGLSTFKWVYYWGTADSKQLAIACNHNKKNPDGMCLALAKKVMDAFPKSASETQSLRNLDYSFATTSHSSPEVNGDRLSQTYTEKKEKDEDDFQPILTDFLTGKDIDLSKAAKQFTLDYPKSILRFRAIFLLAESLNRTGSKKEAAPFYQSLIDQVPLSFYAIVSAERLGVNLEERVQKNPVQVDPDLLNPNPQEQLTLDRAKALFADHDEDEVGIELDSLTRVRNYSNDFLLYIARFAYEANQNLVTFKIFNELIQRKYEHLLSDDVISLIFPDRYLKEIQDQSSVRGVDPLLVISLMKQESGFKAPILSSSGAIGLMQLMSFTAIEMDNDLILQNLKDPKVNISVGTKYLGSLLDKYNGNIPFALSAYNAGPNRVAKWKRDLKPGGTLIDFIEAIPYKETRDYVMTILRNRYWYQYRKGVAHGSIFDVWK